MNEKKDDSGLNLLLVVAVLLFLFWWSSPPPPAPEPANPAPAPGGRPTLYIFTTKPCPQCEKMKKSMEDRQVKDALKAFAVVEMDVSAPEAKRYNVESAPTLVIVGRKLVPELRVGYMTVEQLVEWLTGEKPKPHRRPWGEPDCDQCNPKSASLAEQVEGNPGKPVIGGRTGPDGAVTVTCDLPAHERKKNIASKGLGCCVFRSGEYAARWQQVVEFYDLPEKMVQAGIEGGGYPEKVDRVFAKFGPNVQYIQDTSGDPEILEAILRSGRMPCVTYNGHDPHYGGGTIAHMVCLPYFDRQSGWACVSDNNFVGEDEFVWMACDEFVKRWRGGGNGWVYCLLAVPPPPVPHN